MVKRLQNHGPFGCNSPRILAARCSHTYKRTSVAGVVENGVFLSTLTAETLTRRKGFQNRGREACDAAVQHLSSAAQSRACRLPVFQNFGGRKPTWVRIADPNNPFTALSKASQACLEWLGSCLKHSPTQVWFAETWTMQDVRRVWPCLSKPAQRYIACFETLAQLALLQATQSHIGGGRYSFSMLSGTDNSAAEAGINKMFTTSWPLQIFVQLVASW